ncbi:MAG: hypothetical protein KAQ74_04280, partial [Dehalococcoidia bacterium]|nr:hypothetical protein [Dehalococcoidia bacterium]
MTLDVSEQRLIVEDFTFEARGTTVGLNFLRLTFNGTASVAVAGELDVLGKNPRFWCDLVIECTDADGIPRVTDISTVKVANYEPDLSSADLDTIAEKLNCIIEASGAAIGSPGTELVSIAVVNDGTPKVQLTWTDTTTLHGAPAIQQAASDAAGTLATKANDYFGAETPEWEVGVV